MKRKWSFTAGVAVGVFLFAVLARAQLCSTGGPIERTSLTFASRTTVAALVGFSEFTNPSMPAKKYRRKQYSGTAEFYTYSDPCSGTLTFTVSCTLSGACQYDPETGALTSTAAQYCNGNLNNAGSCSDLSPGPGRGVTVGQTFMQAFPTPECYQNGKSVSDTYRIELSDEDTEADALSRATVTTGTDNVAYRTTRTTGFTFGTQTVQYTAGFKVECSGDYDVTVTHSTKPHGSAGPKIYHARVLRRSWSAGFNTISGEVTAVEADVDYTIEDVKAHLPCGEAPPTSAEYNIGSINMSIGLGKDVAGFSAGALRLEQESITITTYTPVALIAAVSDGNMVEVVRDVTNLRQVRAPQTLADVITLDAASYEVRFYAPAQVGTQDPITKIYAVSGTPIAVYKFENPDAAQSLTTRLWITETRGSSSKVTEYAYDSSAMTWSLSTGNGLRRESEVTTTVGGDQVKTKTIRNDTNTVVSKTARTYHMFAWGEELIKEVLDPDTAALTTTYEFYDSVATSDPNYKRLKQRTDSNGYWERYTYEASGRTIKTIRPFLNAGPSTTDEALCRITENIYDTIANADGDTVPEVRATTIEWLLGLEIGRRYRIDWSQNVTLGGDVCKRRSDIVCVASGAAWDAAGNLVTETLSYSTDTFTDRERRRVNADGTATLTSYSLAGNGVLTTTTKSGAPNVAKDDILDGRRTITVMSAAGQVTSEQVVDISSGLSLSLWVATQFDSIGRPTRLDFDDGTYITKDYACCGLASERDRTGLVTSYTYDALGRQITSTRLGINTKTTYDADGRVKAVIRVGTDTTEMTRESSVYDLAGRQIERRDAGNRLTTIVESFSSSTGQTTRTTTNPDTGTVIEVVARDGSRISVSGTAAAPHSFDYGVDGSGVFVKDTFIGQDSGGQPTTTEWVKSYTDFAGRSYKTVYADSAFNQSYYNLVGQLVRQVDPDGVTTLFSYNSRGEQESTAVDLNGNNLIDAAGTDRLTKTVRSVATKTESSINYTVLRSTTQVWETDNQDTPVTVSIAEQSSDGLRMWQEVRGLTTKSVTVLDGSGGRTVTTTTPDGVKTIQVYAGDRLSSATVKTAGDVQISAATFGYDAHGRMSSTTDARNGTTTLTYYADDQINTVTTPDPDTTLSGPGYDPQTTTYVYNSAGKVQSVTQPDSGVISTTYWLTGAVKRTSGARTYPTEYTYDPQGRVKTLTTWQNLAGDSGKAVTTWNYDPARGFLLNKRYSDNTGPTYTYKPSGRLFTRTWARTPVITTTYTYNAAGELSGTDYSDATPDVTLTYDRSGRPKTMTDGAGARTLAYHASGQLEDETYTAGLLNGIVVDRTFDSFHRLSGLAVPSVSSVGYSYDAASRLDTVTSGQNTATYVYLANSPLVNSVTFKNSGTTRMTATKTYDKLNRLSGISSLPSAAGATAIAYNYQYNAANQRTRATREDNSYWSYAYDPLGQVTNGSKFLSDNSASIGLSFGYTYDDIGNRKTTTVNGQSATYTPTLLNQYSQRTVPGAIDVLGAADPAATVTVAVNSGNPEPTTRQGDRFHKQVAVTNTSTAQNTQLKITGVKNLAGPSQEDVTAEITKNTFTAQTPESFTYDADGNLTDDARWKYSWDGENRLIAIETSVIAAGVGVARQRFEFGYDGQSRRVSKKVFSWSGSAWTMTSHTLFCYDGWNLLADMNGLSGNAVVCTYVWGLDLSGSMQDAGGVGGLLFSTLGGQAANHAYASDGNGNTVGLVDMTTGARSASYDYNVFGETIAIDGTAALGNAFRFSSKYNDETGLLYYGYRFYDSNNGRWLSRDPIEENGGVNLYGYVGNDPINLFDPDGREPMSWDYKHTPSLKRFDFQQWNDAFSDRITKWRNDDFGHTDQLYGRCRELRDYFDKISRGLGACPMDKALLDQLKNQMDWCKKTFGPSLQHAPEKGKKFTPYNELQLQRAVGGAVVGYFAYRVVRMIPSVAVPFLWPTIPINAAAP